MDSIKVVLAIVALNAAVLVVTFARPHDDSTRPRIDNGSTNHTEENGLQLANLPKQRWRRDQKTYNACYQKLANGRPKLKYYSSLKKFGFVCEQMAPSSCSCVIGDYGYAKCEQKIQMINNVPFVKACGCATRSDGTTCSAN